MDRRQAIGGMVLGGVALTLPGCASGSGAGSAGGLFGSSDSPELAAAVDEGIAYFRRRCEEQLPLLTPMQTAIRARDLDLARRAYVEARPPYEEIETLAASFEEVDADIDARPYAFDGGEDDPEFRGFHRAEVLLFAHNDLDAAAPFVDGLVESVRTLQRQLGERGRFSAAGQFGGMYALTNEVSAKKISSEEETWSDQSLLIFRHNWIGVYSQYKPFDALVRARNPETSEAVNAAHRDAMGLLTDHFRPGSAAGTPYSRIGIPERRAMASASLQYRDAITAAAEALGIEPA